jgi:peroxiredoxin
MATPPVCDFGWNAPAFDLPATDGARYTLDRVMGPKGAVIMFICNHCPFVVSVVDRLATDGKDLQAMGVGVAAICSNDARAYPADSFENMGRFAAEAGFTFPYLHDEDQSVARAYGASCTPDFFGLNAQGALQYRGRLDDAGRSIRAEGAPRDLVDAMSLIAETGNGPQDQVASMGCSIKWKAA